ncbi:MAG: ATP-binding protein [Alphaproteobacteria bacterium]|nr:ATP-binding protein [Alphaproteobacteria bacterium]
MYRRIIEDLKRWKQSPERKPLILRGARQCGKTWILKEFGKTQYKKIAYILFDDNKNIKRIFEESFNINRIITAIEIECGFKIEPSETLIFFDEIQECPQALKSLKYFCESAPEYHIVSAGSLLGLTLHQDTGFPVGKVDFLDLYPLDFEEFLLALKQDGLCSALHSQDWTLINSFKDRYIEYLRYYYFIGGMPEAVADFGLNKDFQRVKKIKSQIIDAYKSDFSKHAPFDIVNRIIEVYQSLPSQLAKENKKFIYGVIKKGARAKEYSSAINWLCDAGLVYKIPKINKPALPLMAYQDIDSFKLFMSDTGLLCSLSGLDVKVILEQNTLFQEFKGALTEQYVLQQLKVNNNFGIFYWSSETTTSELDFLLQYTDRIIPIEVKAAENLQAKSLKFFREKFSIPLSIRFSLADFREDKGLTNIPLYGAMNLQQYLETKE